MGSTRHVQRLIISCHINLVQTHIAWICPVPVGILGMIVTGHAPVVEKSTQC
jgi:hypothetical protein